MILFPFPLPAILNHSHDHPISTRTDSQTDQASTRRGEVKAPGSRERLVLLQQYHTLGTYSPSDNQPKCQTPTPSIPNPRPNNNNYNNPTPPSPKTRTIPTPTPIPIQTTMHLAHPEQEQGPWAKR